MSTGIDESAIAVRFGAVLRGLRYQYGLSMSQLAAQVGISQPYLSQLERGLATPSMATIYRIAAALDVAPGDLLPTHDASVTTVVRSGEGRIVRVSELPNSANMRILAHREGGVASVREYSIGRNDYLEEWYTTRGALCIYVIAGALQVEVVGDDTYELTTGDYLSLPSGVTQRWKQRGQEGTRLLCVAFDA